MAERVLEALVEDTVADPGLYQILLYFGVVACSEEGAKYFMLKRRTWNSPEFNCQFDGVVYGVFVSLGHDRPYYDDASGILACNRLCEAKAREILEA